MKPSHILASALVSLAAITPATADTWQFSYTGFYDADAGVFDPNYRIAGSFSATDANHDSRIEKSELTDFTINGDLPYLPCTQVQNPRPLRHCDISSFSYLLGSRQLNFETHEYHSDPEGFYYWYTDIRTGSAILQQTYFGIFTVSLKWSSQHNWTEQTVLAVTGPGPVPEPGTYAMLLAGMGLVGYAARRRRTRG
ncbi:PEP-CTERM sorting domain-containing protein [Duganella sp. HH101]|uniref:PEP-CTERM sorting domain-containing protein n=1 Tax=Duganella sp. HH101 TaxID=1781066 RepID=UPI000874489C|nr:PEP-CTERM sorting domain-containing protein [Duganella sp. HH101]OFA07107.1 PEP-CTERM motif protein [Duganella sp. HH101]